MRIRPFATGAASLALAGGMVFAGASAASASTWTCPHGAACGYETGETKDPAFEKFVNANNLGWVNKVRNHGQYEKYRDVRFYFKYIPHGEHDWVKFSKCVTWRKKGHQAFVFKHDHSKTAYVYKLRWTTHC